MCNPVQKTNTSEKEVEGRVDEEQTVNTEANVLHKTCSEFSKVHVQSAFPKLLFYRKYKIKYIKSIEEQ